MNVFVKIRSNNDVDENNCFFLEDLNGGPEEQWLLAELAAASEENGKYSCYPTFHYYIIPDEDLELFKEFYYAQNLPFSLFDVTLKKCPKEKLTDWWGMIL